MSMRHLLVAAVFLLSACAHKAPFDAAQGDTRAAQGDSDATIRVVTTISTLNSFVEGVGGEHVSVRSIVPIGASPETFAPAPQDAAEVSNASLLVENGADLESWLDGLLRDAGARNLRVVVCSDGLPVKGLNPHLWMDPVLAQRYVLKIRDALSAVDPVHAAEYRLNAQRYNGRLAALRTQIQARIDTIPAAHRYMIVFHNAWQYYNDRFGITTLGFVERNPGQSPNPQQVAQLIDLAKAHHVRGVFSEPEYSSKLLYSIAQGAGIRVVENLYDDSVGTDPRVADYIAMLTYDTNIIVQTLR